jgi:hypothetical protein
MRVIERRPGRGELKYKNVLANSEESRYLTSTAPSSSATRTADGYSIQCDIDEEVCRKWATKIGKATQTLSESMQHLCSSDPTIRDDIRYPDCLMMADVDSDDESNEDEEPPTKRQKIA